jgi:hypothetical protein
MIQAISISTDLPDIEVMAVSGTSEPDAPLSCEVNRADLSPADQTTYDVAVALFLADQYTNINNTTAELSISRITSTPITVETEDVDFLALPEVDKDKLRNLLAVFISLNDF